jgi:hypothetical protein
LRDEMSDYESDEQTVANRWPWSVENAYSEDSRYRSNTGGHAVVPDVSGVSDICDTAFVPDDRAIRLTPFACLADTYTV